MTYEGNMLINANDSANDTEGFRELANGQNNEFSYDSNGNMLSDDNRGLSSVKYNLLNLPNKLTDNINNISYIYDATGVKLAKLVSSDGGTRLDGSIQDAYSNSTYYQGAFIYSGDSLEYVITAEGLCYPNSGGNLTQEFSYNYHLKDHLGNVRVVVDQNGDVTQQTDYYPFGMEMKSSSTVNNRYKYNGKEAQNDYIGGAELRWLDYGARMYDPSIGKWNVVDPLSEDYFRWSPYVYCLNNPINAIDPNGQLVIFVNGYHQGFAGVFGINNFSYGGNMSGARDYWNGLDNRFISRLQDNNDRYRVIKSVEQLYYNGSSSWSNYQVISTKYDFVGTIYKTRVKHHLGSGTNIIEQEYNYDHVGLIWLSLKVSSR